MKWARPVTLLAIAVATFALLPLFAPQALAATRMCSLVDDDWEPSMGKRSGRYTEDPGYEVFIQEALDTAGIDYQTFEIWQNDSIPTRPTLNDLIQFPLCIWSCAANELDVLQVEEMTLLTDYMNLGGKVILSGQGILNDLIRHQGETEYDLFLSQILGVEGAYLDFDAIEVMPNSDNAFFANLPIGVFDYESLPDSETDRVDFFNLMPGAEGFLDARFPQGGGWFPVSSDRYADRPIHFQSWMFAALPERTVRAQYISSIAAWLGFLGDDLYSFMDGIEDFTVTSSSPNQILEWDPGKRALLFESHGDLSGREKIKKPLSPEGGDWVIGFDVLVTDPGEYSSMNLLSLGEAVSLELFSGANGDCDLRFRTGPASSGCEKWAFGLSVQKHLRILLLFNANSQELTCKVNNYTGNWIWEDTCELYDNFQHLSICSHGLGSSYASPIIGFIDDLFFAGNLNHLPTSVDEEGLPGAVCIRGAAPNPFNPTTRIHFESMLKEDAIVSIYDSRGRCVRRLEVPQGASSIEWKGRDQAGLELPSGIYLAKIADTVTGCKLVLLK